MGAVIAALLVSATLSASPTFGGPIATHVAVQLDPARVDPSSVHIVADPGPLTWLSAPRTTTKGSTVTLDRVATCIDEPCLTKPRLPNVIVTATSRDGRPLRAETAWPALHVRGRVTAADLQRSRPPFRVNTVPPAPSYSTDPSRLAWLLDAAAVVLVLGAIALVVPLLVRRFRREPEPEEALARALRLAREAEDRAEPDKRRALGLLARLLPDRRLARDASDLAWSKPAPQRESVAALVGEAEK